MSTDQMRNLRTLDLELAKESMRGLWVREETLRREPAPFGKPILWKWAKIREGLQAASRLVTTNYKGSRRAISLIHPTSARAQLTL
jgi:gentisate 1,2-dioxygenase